MQNLLHSERAQTGAGNDAFRGAPLLTGDVTNHESRDASAARAIDLAIRGPQNTRTGSAKKDGSAAEITRIIALPALTQRGKLARVTLLPRGLV